MSFSISLKFEYPLIDKFSAFIPSTRVQASDDVEDDVVVDNGKVNRGTDDEVVQR